MRGKLLFIMFLLVVLFFSACTTESPLPAGPDIGNAYTSEGRYEILSMNLVQDFDGTPSAPGLFPSDPGTTSDTANKVTNWVDSQAYDNSDKNNKFMEIEFVIHDISSYAYVEIGWKRGPISLYDFGNALMIRARTVAGDKMQNPLSVRFEHERLSESDDYNFYYKVIYLTTQWKDYIIKFEDTIYDSYTHKERDYVFSNNLKIRFEVPHSLSVVNKRGIYQIDDIRLITLVQSR